VLQCVAVRCSVLQCVAALHTSTTRSETICELWKNFTSVYNIYVYIYVYIWFHSVVLKKKILCCTCIVCFVSLSLWVLCHFTGFTRLVWGRSKCPPSFLIQSDLCIVCCVLFVEALTFNLVAGIPGFYRSLLQNIVSFIGLFCKRDL